MRKLATIRKIADIQPIEGADAIEVATVDGWKVVVKRGEFNVGDLCVYFEIDSVLPIRPEFEFLRKGCYVKKDWLITEQNPTGEGFRLRTIKLLGQISQGLVIPLETVPEKGITRAFRFYDENGVHHRVVSHEGEDVTDVIGVVKWDPPLPAQLSGRAKGNFPSFIPKTDQERCCDGRTVLITDKGYMTIKEICDSRFSGKALSFNHTTGVTEFKPIVGHSTMTRKRDQWLQITTKTGKRMLVTRNHKVYLPTLGCYREAGSLQIGDTVIILL